MEILGNKLKRFFDIVDDPPNDAEITYAGNRYEVWEVSEDLFNKMCDMSKEEFVKLAGEEAWWRQSDGSVLGVPDTKFIINGEETDSNIPMPEVQSPKNVIPSASEANKMTNNAIDSCTTQQLTELSKLIRDAIADGKFSICEDGYLKPETRKKLEGLGYKVETGTQYNESYYSISWRKTK